MPPKPVPTVWATVPRAGLSAEIVVREAAIVVDESGVDALTLAVVAERLGVRTPSLYKHVDGMPALQRGIMLAAKTDLVATLGRAAVGKAGGDAIRAIAIAYRRWAIAHPGWYPTTVRAPVPGDEEDLAVSEAFTTLVFAVLGGYELRGDDAIDATRFLRSALHGFVALETGHAFELPVDIDRSYARLVDSVVTALSTWSASGGKR
jgi:AcrR family transcriptional regulator